MTAIAAVTNVARPRVYGYYRIAGASEPASYRWITNASVASSGGIVRYSGASGLDAPAVKASGLSGTTATVPGVTTVTSNAMVVGCMGVGLSATPVQITGPASMSQVGGLTGTQNEFDDAGQPTPGPPAHGPGRSRTRGTGQGGSPPCGRGGADLRGGGSAT